MSRLRILRDVVVGVYGPANRAAFTFERTMEMMEHLQQDLATQAAWDLPGYPSNSLYFEDTPSYQARSGSARVGPIAYTSAPPLMPSVKAGPPPAETPVEEAAPPVAEKAAAPILKVAFEGASESD